MAETQPLERMRLDKWLWAARFFKTRQLACEAINGGKVHLEGQRTKPGKEVRVGNRLSIHKGSLAWDLVDPGPMLISATDLRLFGLLARQWILGGSRGAGFGILYEPCAGVCPHFLCREGQIRG